MEKLNKKTAKEIINKISEINSKASSKDEIIENIIENLNNSIKENEKEIKKQFIYNIVIFLFLVIFLCGVYFKTNELIVFFMGMCFIVIYNDLFKTETAYICFDKNYISYLNAYFEDNKEVTKLKVVKKSNKYFAIKENKPIQIETYFITKNNDILLANFFKIEYEKYGTEYKTKLKLINITKFIEG